MYFFYYFIINFFFIFFYFFLFFFFCLTSRLIFFLSPFRGVLLLSISHVFMEKLQILHIFWSCWLPKVLIFIQKTGFKIVFSFSVFLIFIMGIQK